MMTLWPVRLRGTLGMAQFEELFVDYRSQMAVNFIFWAGIGSNLGGMVM